MACHVLDGFSGQNAEREARSLTAMWFKIAALFLGGPGSAVQAKRKVQEGSSQLAVRTTSCGRAGVKLGDKNVVSNCIAHEFSIILRAKHLHDPVLMERNRFG